MLVLRSLKSGVIGGRTAVVQIHGSIGGAVKSPDVERLMKQVLEDSRFPRPGPRYRLRGRRRVRIRTTSTAPSDESPTKSPSSPTFGASARQAAT